MKFTWSAIVGFYYVPEMASDSSANASYVAMAPPMLCLVTGTMFVTCPDKDTNRFRVKAMNAPEARKVALELAGS